MRQIFTLLFIYSTFVLSSQTARIPESDPVPSRVVLYVPSATTSQIQSLEPEFAKYAQITNAKYVSTHKCILLDLGDVQNPKFTVYAELVKVISQFIPYKDIKIKSPLAYDEIKAALDSAPIIIK